MFNSELGSVLNQISRQHCKLVAHYLHAEWEVDDFFRVRNERQMAEPPPIPSSGEPSAAGSSPATGALA
ncbi:hypothetical protein PoB_002246200 [Plakobranchus ocellatus]|uniref:Uncharacterized protein n=1 Tax=Plakobranchus ocellatus TaxID=259542 RepID=A0AAV3ZL22_9GAST|nr:hypothetical protein PoB_002246200 [Plakobranchus ocellatus]